LFLLEVLEPVYSNAFHARCLERFAQADWSCNGSLAPDEIHEIFADMARDDTRLGLSS
jgi:hypothetical protein